MCSLQSLTSTCSTPHLHMGLCSVGYLVTLRGVFYDDHDLVTISNIGFSDSTAINATLTTNYLNGSQHEGNWIVPDGTTVDSSGSVPGFRGPLIVRLLRTSGTPQQGIYQCVAKNATVILRTLHIGLYSSGEGVATLA